MPVHRPRSLGCPLPHERSIPQQRLHRHRHLLLRRGPGSWIWPAASLPTPECCAAVGLDTEAGTVSPVDRAAAGARRRRRPDDHRHGRDLLETPRLRRASDVITSSYFSSALLPALAAAPPRRDLLFDETFTQRSAGHVTPTAELADNELPSARPRLRLRHYRDEQDAGDPASACTAASPATSASARHESTPPSKPPIARGRDVCALAARTTPGKAATPRHRRRGARNTFTSNARSGSMRQYSAALELLSHARAPHSAIRPVLAGG